MFYSQFILAKKGPLGTIWIAAHLERKLRKNQVADTDIGVSVDSILFPEVPIALRLSSHLLLGVVRIYSRKVNYLFDDCSEALLKVKQAFRSTAVDLPPEESTAPYHSITLPETFDLDDFELPDNDLFQGNYVDHHISTKEQITLQDTMDGVVYSTSQFGLDERFGDGDTSQIGLDLDEDLFVDKLAAPAQDGVVLNSDADPQTSVQLISPSKEDENYDEMNEASEAMTASVSANQLEALAANIESRDYAQAPSTPGLVEEPNLSTVQKAMACDDRLETDVEAMENVEPTSSKIDHDAPLDGMLVEESGYKFDRKEIQQPKGDLPSTAETVEPLHNGVLSNHEPSVDPRGVRLDETVSSPSSSHETSGENSCQRPCSGFENIPENIGLNSTHLTVAEDIPGNDQALLLVASDNAEIPKNVEESCTPINGLESNTSYPMESPSGPEMIVKDQVHHEPKDCMISEPIEETPSTHFPVLQACNSDLVQLNKLSLGGDNSVAAPDLPSDVDGPCSLETVRIEDTIHASGASSEIQGEGCNPTAAVKPVLEVKWMSEPNLCEDIEVRINLDEQVDNTNSKDTLETPTSSAVSELSAPEKLLSMPEEPKNLPNDLLIESTPDKVVAVESEGDGTGFGIISGKKRSFTESTLTLQSLNSDESFAKPQSKRTAEYIPDDDDLLSSILVGRKSSILKMKPTPTPAIVPMKRPRTAPRASATKRKVLMDDTMVLHGDTIREQLTSTEDIRRVRKKAPSTRYEIWMLQKQFLEEEIFSEPLSTGISVAFIGLQNQTYDLSRIQITQDESVLLLNSEKDVEPNVWPNVIKATETKGITDTSGVGNVGEAQSAEIVVHTEAQQGEDISLRFGDNDTVQMEATSPATEIKTSNHELGEIAEMEIDGGIVKVPDAAEHSVAPLVESSSSTCPVSDASVYMHASCLPPDQKLDSQSVDNDASLLDVSNGKGNDAINVAEIHHDNILEFWTESGAMDEHLMKETAVGESSEIRADSCVDSSAPTDNAGPSVTTMSPETGGCKDLAVGSDNQSMDEIIQNEPEFVKNDEILEQGYGDKNLALNHTCCEEPMYSVEFDKNDSWNGGLNDSLNDVEKRSCVEAEAHGITDVETTGIDHPSVEDHGDMENIIVEHDTEFLNVDDDEVAEEDDNYMPSAEETRFLENSGWSSRTRAVAKYLQTLFDKEAERGKKVIPMDNLLSGKTRKEASRMFFETLVLKTRDYVHVEQPNPFDNINIKPRGKLMKSDF